MTLFNKGRPCGRRGEGLRPVRADVMKNNVVKKVEQKVSPPPQISQKEKVVENVVVHFMLANSLATEVSLSQS